MKPFCGYHMGDYWAHWLEMGEKLGDKAPKIFNVNWFKQDENGNFIWPGFGDNMRVLDWIIKRCEGTIDADETAIGYLPKKGDINVKGIEDEVTPEVMDKLLAVDKELWKKDVADMREFYKQFGDKLLKNSAKSLISLKKDSKNNFIIIIKKNGFKPFFFYENFENGY